MAKVWLERGMSCHVFVLFFSELGFWEDFVLVTNVILIRSCDSLQIGSGAIAEKKVHSVLCLASLMKQVAQEKKINWYIFF